MKKHKDCDGQRTYHQINRNFLRGLLILSVLLFQCFQLSAVGHAQNARLNLNLRNVSISDVFKAIKQQTKLSVVYNLNDVNPNHKVTVSATNEEVTSVLNKILKGTNLSYTIENNHIVLSTSKVLNESNLQNRTQEKGRLVKGMVSDLKGEPLIGVSVQIKGTNKGAMTDLDGKFVITANKGDILKLSYVGFKSKSATVDDGDLNIMLEESSEVLEEVVVTALGIKREQKALTYNVQELKAAELVTVKDANFMNALSGKVAGVTINTSSSGIGGGARVVMRGTKSISGNNNAMYVIDGIPLPSIQSSQPSDLYSGMGQSGDGISALNVDDIESMSVLSGASAAALYGSEAANGVVMITTKKGQKDKFSVNVSNSTTFSSPFILPKFQNRYGSELGSFQSWGEKLQTSSTYEPTDFFQTGYNTMNSISLSTGTEKNQTYFSASVVKARGIIPNNELSRYNLSFRNSCTFLKDKFNFDFSLMYMNVEEQNMLAQGQYFNPLVPIYLFPRGEDINKYKVYERYNPERNFKTQYWPYGDMGLQMQNPYWIINRDMFNNERNRFLINTSLKYNITDWMSITARGKYDGTNSLNQKKYNASTLGLFAGKTGAYHRFTGNSQHLYGDVMLNINKYIGDFSVTAVLGSSVSDIRNTDITIGGNLFGTANLFSLTNMELLNLRPNQFSYHDQTQAIFSTAQIGYKSVLYFDVTGRNDWVSSLAGTKSKSIFYPSVGISAILTEMLPFKSNVLSFLKLRASYSEVGNAPSRYVSIATYPITGGFPQTNTYMPDENFKPERTKSYEVGVNTKLFNNKVNLDITFYKSSTFNQLFHPTLPPSTGYNSLYINAGRIDNRGVEASIALNQKLGFVKWTSRLIYSLNQNVIKQLLPDTSLPNGIHVSQDRLDMGGTSSYRMILTNGGSMGDIYVNCLKTDEHGSIYVGKDTHTVVADPDTYIKAGNASPKYTLGWRNDFEWKGLSFGCLINARIGGVGVSVTQAIMDSYGVSENSAIARDNDGVMVNGVNIPAKPYYQIVGGGTSGIGSPYVYSATNIRLSEVSLGYDIPVNNWCKFIKGLQVSFVGRNLLMFYSKAPFDPESTASTGTYYQGIDYFMQPSLKNLGFSVKINF